MKDAYYFSHDSNASQDPKILQMCSVYKAEGYGWYWILIEAMRNEQEYKLSLQGKYVFNSYAIRTYTDADTIKQFIKDCIEEFNLFESDGVYFWSNSLIRRMDKMKEKSEKARQSVQARWEKKRVQSGGNTNVSNDNTNEPENDSINESKGNESKGNESKGNESKGNESKGNESKGNESKGNENVPDNSAAALKRVVDVFNANIHIAAPMEMEKISDWLDDIEPEVMIAAIGEALSNNGRSWSYINAILNAWFKAGIKTEEAVEAYLRDKQDKKNKEHQQQDNRGDPNALVWPGSKKVGNTKAAGFNSYDQRNYNIKELEKRLLGQYDGEDEGGDEAAVQ